MEGINTSQMTAKELKAYKYAVQVTLKFLKKYRSKLEDSSPGKRK